MVVITELWHKTVHICVVVLHARVSFLPVVTNTFMHKQLMFAPSTTSVHRRLLCEAAAFSTQTVRLKIKIALTLLHLSDMRPVNTDRYPLFTFQILFGRVSVATFFSCNYLLRYNSFHNQLTANQANHHTGGVNTL